MSLFDIIEKFRTLQDQYKSDTGNDDQILKKSQEADGPPPAELKKFELPNESADKIINDAADKENDADKNSGGNGVIL